MIQIQRLTAALTPLDAVLALLGSDLEPVDPIDVPLSKAIGCIAAAMPPPDAASPAFDTAVTDGWAMRSLDLVGASSYSPLPLATSPRWVEAGERLPDGCDCVIDGDLVEQVGPIHQVVAEAVPGQGVRRTGEEIGAGRSLVGAGRRVEPIDALVAGAAGIDRLWVRSPRIRVIDVPSANGDDASSRFIADFARAAGGDVTAIRCGGRDAGSIIAAVGDGACDLLVVVGGTGAGRSDATIQALRECAAVQAHGIAMQPGATAAVGRRGGTPVIAVPGATDQALAACLLLLQPVLDRLTARAPRQQIVRPLARKIASTIGIAEMVLLKLTEDGWSPLAARQLSLDSIARADAWLVVPGNREGFAAGTQVGAFALRETFPSVAR